MSELLPCPFCGEPPRLGEDSSGAVCVECINWGECACPRSCDDSKRVAIDRWNRRAT
jgi:hypothetical protein